MNAANLSELTLLGKGFGAVKKRWSLFDIIICFKMSQ